MKSINKYEVIGIFASIAVMALALLAIRFDFSEVAAIPEESQQASLVSVGNGDVREAVTDSVGIDGELKRLVIDDVRLGVGKAVQEGDTVRVHYKGTLRDGTKFDDSYVRGSTFEFTVGEGEVIKGWDEGIIGMQVGGERILVVPPDMAYGNRQVGPIPPNSPLIFSVELVSIE